MEEKERYKIDKSTNYYTNTIVDTETNAYYGAISRDDEDAQNLINLLNQQDKRIKEFEKKLDIVRQKDIIIRQNCRQGYVKDLEEMNNLAEENQQLKKQLAEKDKEFSEYVKIVDNLHKQLSDKCDFCDRTKDQDKILFAVEQLEKLKVELHIIHTNGYLKAIDEEIDNQIKQLKEMK